MRRMFISLSLSTIAFSGGGAVAAERTIVLAVDNMVLHKSGPRPDLAYQFINFMLEGKNASELSNMIGSGAVNAAAMPFIDEAVKNNRAVFPDAEGMKTLQMLKDYDRKSRRLLNRLWTEVKVR